MKISSLNPQFIIESPTAIDEAASTAETAAPSLRVVPSEPSAAPDNSGGHLDRETRDGLKRLSRLIQGKKLKTARVLAIYKRIDSREDLSTHRGTHLNIIY